MGEKRISQEGLKLLACISMLLDHIGAVFLPGTGLRIIGRIAFPIYCFLLCEGISHTRNTIRYGMRLALGALLAELPHDLLFYGGISWGHQSVMLTLLLGYAMAICRKKTGHFLLPFLVCFFTAEWLHTDYGGWGIALIALFLLTESFPARWKYQLLGMLLIFAAMNSYRVNLLDMRIPIQLFGVLSLIPIQLYSGKKNTKSRWIQLYFYLFYPAHLLLLLLLEMR